MLVRSIVRNLLVGQSHISSRLEFKSAMLRGYIALLALIVVVAYMIIDSRHGLVENNPYYVTVAAVALFTIALNRRHQFQLANLLFLCMINFLLFLFANSDIYRTGIYMYFICISIAAFALYGFKYVQYAVLFSLLSLTLFLMSYFAGVSILPTPVYTEAYITISFITNFLMVLVLAVLIVYFLINLNHHSEQDLIRASEELLKSRERNEMVVVAVDAGIYEWKHIEQTIFISATWKKLLGYGEDELQNFDLAAYYSIIHPDDKENVERNIAAHMKTRKPYANELRLRKKDLSYFWFLDSGNTKFNEQGIPTITVGSIFDINDRKLAEEKILRQNELLAKANKELDQFVYSVSHDLRAPLSTILGLANIYDLSIDKKEKENIIRLIRDRANTLDDFIKEILDYSRNSRTDLKVQPVNVLKLITEVINGLRYMQGFDRIEIETLIPQDLEVKTDRERLKVIMSNLIANSVKYQDKGKEPFIRISSSRAHHDGLSLFVKDNGIGIELEHQGRIFDMFYQAHDHAHGSGLGLYIAKEAVQRLQGKIDVHSEFQVGTTFTVTLPVER